MQREEGRERGRKPVENWQLAALTSTAESRVGAAHTVRAGWRKLQGSALVRRCFYRAYLQASVCLYCTTCKCEKLSTYCKVSDSVPHIWWLLQRGRLGSGLASPAGFWLGSTWLPGIWQGEENTTHESLSQWASFIQHFNQLRVLTVFPSQHDTE